MRRFGLRYQRSEYRQMHANDKIHELRRTAARQEEVTSAAGYLRPKEHGPFTAVWQERAIRPPQTAAGIAGGRLRSLAPDHLRRITCTRSLALEAYLQRRSP